MQKTVEYTTAMREDFVAYKARILRGDVEAGFAALSHKLEAALASSALKKDDVVKNMSKKTLKRKESRARKVQLLLEGKAHWQLNAINETEILIEKCSEV